MYAVKLGAIYSELFGHMDFLPNVCVHIYLRLQGKGLGRAVQLTTQYFLSWFSIRLNAVSLLRRDRGKPS